MSEAIDLKPRGLPTIHHLYNRFFFAGLWAPTLNLDGFSQIRSPDGVLSADCIIVHLASILATNQAEQLFRLRKTTPARQVWVVETLESAANFPHFEDPEFMSLFDIEVSYRQQADIWTPYIPSDLASRYRNVTSGYRRKTCCAFVSSSWDKSGRRQYMRELMHHLKVDSFGRFARNKWILFDRGEKTKLRLLKNYHFTLAFENSVAPDYVTEKFYQPLLTGTIPIYLGAPNIDEFAPGENCFINARDFKSPAQLAAFIRQSDPSEFHTWRQQELRPEFLRQLDRLKLPWKSELARMINARLEAAT